MLFMPVQYHGDKGRSRTDNVGEDDEADEAQEDDNVEVDDMDVDDKDVSFELEGSGNVTRKGHFASPSWCELLPTPLED